MDVAVVKTAVHNTMLPATTTETYMFSLLGDPADNIRHQDVVDSNLSDRNNRTANPKNTRHHTGYHNTNMTQDARDHVKNHTTDNTKDARYHVRNHNTDIAYHTKYNASDHIDRHTAHTISDTCTYASVGGTELAFVLDL